MPGPEVDRPRDRSVPPCARRDSDGRLREAVGAGGFVFLTDDRLADRTRSGYETVRYPADHLLIAPRPAARLSYAIRAAKAHPHPCCGEVPGPDTLTP